MTYKSSPHAHIDTVSLTDTDTFMCIQNYDLNETQLVNINVDDVTVEMFRPTWGAVSANPTQLSISANADIADKSYIIKDSTSDYKLYDVCKTIFYNALRDTVNSTYANSSLRVIDNLSSGFIYGFTSSKDTSQDITELKLRSNIPASFNEVLIADNIENLTDSIENYNDEYREIIQLELNSRAKARDALKPESRYYYYLEERVKKYVSFIENTYRMQNPEVTYGSQNFAYSIDPQYIISEVSSNNLILDNNGTLSVNEAMLSDAAEYLADTTVNIRTIREQIKAQVQRNYMKGSFLLLSYVVNEYLKNNINPVVAKILSAWDVKNIPDVNSQTQLELIQYVDPTQYFNISASTDLSTVNVNPRYWDSATTHISASVGSDYSDTFVQPRAVSFNDFKFSLEALSAFYIETLNNHLASTELSTFLNSVFETGAVSYTQDSVTDDEILASYDIYRKYIGTSDGETPFYYLDNQTHPSYQIHPYLLNFIEYTDFKFPIKNTPNLVDENYYQYISADIDEYVGKYGNLINVWRNPLNVNSDVQSQYELSPNMSKDMIQDPQIDYDGLFYPPVAEAYMNCTEAELDGFINSKYYEILKLSQQQRDKISAQIKAFHSHIIQIASHGDEYTIAKYGKDQFGNHYGLIKPKTDGDNASVLGQLWIRYKNHPLAFPAFAVDVTTSTCRYDLSQIDHDARQSNDYVWSLVTSAHDGIANINKDSPIAIPAQFFDFTMNSDSSVMLASGQTRVQYDDSVASSDDPNYRYAVPVIFNITRKTSSVDGTQSIIFAKDAVAGSQMIAHPVSSSEHKFKFTGFAEYLTSIGAIYVAKISPAESGKSRIAIQYAKYTPGVGTAYVPATPKIVELDVEPKEDTGLVDFSSATNKISIAYLSENPASGLTIRNYCESLDASNEFGTVKSYPESIDGTNTSFDYLDRNVITKDLVLLDNDIAESTDEQSQFNLHADAGFIPVYDSTPSRVWKNSYLSGLNLYKFELLGRSSQSEARGTFSDEGVIGRVFESYTPDTSYVLSTLAFPTKNVLSTVVNVPASMQTAKNKFDFYIMSSRRMTAGDAIYHAHVVNNVVTVDESTVYSSSFADINGVSEAVWTPSGYKYKKTDGSISDLDSTNHVNGIASITVAPNKTGGVVKSFTITRTTEAAQYNPKSIAAVVYITSSHTSSLYKDYHFLTNGVYSDKQLATGLSTVLSTVIANGDAMLSSGNVKFKVDEADGHLSSSVDYPTPITNELASKLQSNPFQIQILDPRKISNALSSNPKLSGFCANYAIGYATNSIYVGWRTVETNGVDSIVLDINTSNSSNFTGTSDGDMQYDSVEQLEPSKVKQLHIYATPLSVDRDQKLQKAGDSVEVAKYYIKNISDDRPKFMLSVMTSL